MNIKKMFIDKKTLHSLGTISLYFYYLAAAICIYLSISCLNYNIDVYYEPSFNVYFRRCLDAFFLALPVLFFRKKIFWCGWLVLLSGYFLSIVWYFRTYSTIMPLSSYFLFENTDGLCSYILGSLELEDFWIVFPLGISLFFAYSKRISYHKEIFHIVAIWFLVLLGLVSLPYWPNSRPAWMQPSSMFNIVGPRAFKEFGIVNFWVYQIGQSRPVSGEEKEFLKDNFEKQYIAGENCYKGSRKNLILILVESLQSWPLGLLHNDVEITPTLNALIKAEGTVYISQMLSQVKDGRSSDAQLLVNAGLLPLNTRAAASLCSDNTFPSIASALKEKGYDTVSFICDERDFWNQGRMTIAYGFDKLYDKLQKDCDKKDADSLLFNACMSHLQELEQPFYAQIVTFSTHMPYNEVQLFDSPLLRSHDLNEDVRNYLIAVQLFDRRLGLFLKDLKAKGLYDNSIIVIVGDHEQVTYNLYEGRTKCKVSDCMVPFIVLNSPLETKHADKVFGQIDVYPSLLHLMGRSDYYFIGLGETIFGDSVSNHAVYRTGEVVYGKGAGFSEAVSTYRKKIWKISDIMLRMDYFAQHK